MNGLARLGLGAAAFGGASGVALGALGAHGLQPLLDARALGWWQTAVQYQVWHALALLGTGVLAAQRPHVVLRIALLAFMAGIVVFAGSLYAMALGAPRWLGAVTPLGGLALIAGWVALGIAALRLRN